MWPFSYIANAGKEIKQEVQDHLQAQAMLQR
jgi:hypothetical protein